VSRRKAEGGLPPAGNQVSNNSSYRLSPVKQKILYLLNLSSSYFLHFIHRDKTNVLKVNKNTHG
jgi:hypothetical protein